jgi:hypothetical protein
MKDRTKEIRKYAINCPDELGGVEETESGNQSVTNNS